MYTLKDKYGIRQKGHKAMCTIYNGKNSILLIKILKYIDKIGEHAYDNNKYNVVYIKTVNAVF
jgi:hypothetical protein